MKKTTLNEIRLLASEAKNKIDKIYLHWTAGVYDDASEDYHLNINQDGSIVLTCNNFTDYKNHTWHRNSNAIAIVMTCCAGAVAYSANNIDYGDYPPTAAQIETMAKIVAVLSDELGLEINSNNVLTHCEAAELDGYGPTTTCERWDLWSLPDVNCDNKLKPGGDVIRGKAIWFQNH